MGFAVKLCPWQVLAKDSDQGSRVGQDPDSKRNDMQEESFLLDPASFFGGVKCMKRKAAQELDD